MSRPFVIIIVLIVAVTATISVTTMIVTNEDGGRSGLSEAQRGARETFFGVSKELPPIPEGQEMRPKW